MAMILHWLAGICFGAVVVAFTALVLVFLVKQICHLIRTWDIPF